MDGVEFERRREELLRELLAWQVKREEVESETRNKDNGLSVAILSKVITPEHFGKICRARASTSCEIPVKNILYPTAKASASKDYTVTSTAKALKTLVRTEKCKVTESGIFIGSDESYLAATPAAVIEGLESEELGVDPENGYGPEIPVGEEGIVEVICPYKARAMTPEEALEKKVGELSKIFLDNFEGLNQSHSLYYQIQGALHIADKRYCILIV